MPGVDPNRPTGSGSNVEGNSCQIADCADVGHKLPAPKAGFSSNSRKVFRACRKMADGSDLPPKTPVVGVHPEEKLHEQRADQDQS